MKYRLGKFRNRNVGDRRDYIIFFRRGYKKFSSTVEIGNHTYGIFLTFPMNDNKGVKFQMREMTDYFDYEEGEIERFLEKVFDYRGFELSDRRKINGQFSTREKIRLKIMKDEVLARLDDEGKA